MKGILILLLIVIGEFILALIASTYRFKQKNRDNEILSKFNYDVKAKPKKEEKKLENYT